jgi:hypothetical protein
MKMSSYGELYTVKRQITDTLIKTRCEPGYAIVVKFLKEKMGEYYTIDELAGYGRYYGLNLGNSRWRDLIWLINEDNFSVMNELKDIPINLPKSKRYDYKTKILAGEGFYISHPFIYCHKGLRESKWVVSPKYSRFEAYMMAYKRHGKRMVQKRNRFLKSCS